MFFDFSLIHCAEFRLSLALSQYHCLGIVLYLEHRTRAKKFKVVPQKVGPGSNFDAIHSDNTNRWPSRDTGKMHSDLNARDGGGHNCRSKHFTALYYPSL